jgi:hypothetical protein
MCTCMFFYDFMDYSKMSVFYNHIEKIGKHSANKRLSPLFDVLNQ